MDLSESKKRFFYLRYCAGLSARQMASVFKLSPPYWALLECGQTPGLKTVRNVTEKLKISMSWLLEGEGEKPTPEHIEATIKQLTKAT